MFSLSFPPRPLFPLPPPRALSLVSSPLSRSIGILFMTAITSNPGVIQNQNTNLCFQKQICVFTKFLFDPRGMCDKKPNLCFQRQICVFENKFVFLQPFLFRPPGWVWQKKIVFSKTNLCFWFVFGDWSDESPKQTQICVSKYKFVSVSRSICG